MRFLLVLPLLPALAVLLSAQPAAVPLTSLLPGDHGFAPAALVPGRSYGVIARVRASAGGPPVRLSFRLVTPAGVDAAEAETDIPADGKWHPARGIWSLPRTAPASGLRLLVAAAGGAKFESEDLAVYPILNGLFNADDPAAIHRLGAEGVRLIWRCSEVAENLAALDHPGRWQAREEGGRRIVQQTSPYLWSRIDLGSRDWRDYALAVSIRPDQSSDDSAIVVRICDRGPEGCAEVDISNEGVAVRAVYPNAVQRLANAKGGWSAGRFSAWRLLARDGVLKVECEGRQVLTVANPIFAGGAIGLATQSCAASFADLNVNSLGGGGALLDSLPPGGWHQTDARPFGALLAAATAEVPIVFTVTFAERNHPGKPTKNADPTRQAPSDEVKTTPVPTGAEADEDLRTIDRFLTQYGHYVSVYSVENEPNFSYAPTDLAVVGGTSRVLDWMKTVAARVRAISRSHPETLGRLAIAAPSLVSLAGQATNRNGYRSGPGGLSFDATLAWANADPNIDLIDIHAHSASLAELQTGLDYICPRADKPLICTEWSEAACNNAWINLPVDPSILAASVLADQTAIHTNADYVRACYRHPVPKAEWDRFVAGSHLSPDFIAQAVRLFDSHGFVLNAYGALIQYGSPRFDLKQLYANQTVVLTADHHYQANGTFPDQFKRAIR